MLRQITYLEDDDIVLLTTSGTYVLDQEVDTLVRLAAELKRRNCRRLLIDHRKTKVIVKTLDAFERPELYQKIWDDASTLRLIRTAIVFGEITEDYKFLENVIANRGWNTRIFDDYEAALDFLRA